MKFENTEVWGFEHALRGMRNPKNSWNKSDSYYEYDNQKDCVTKDTNFVIGVVASLCIVLVELATVPTLYVSNSFHQ